MLKVFIDTNILIYCIDSHTPKKRDQCRGLLKSLQGKYAGVISTQVMQEFYVAATKKMGADPLQIKNILHSFEQFEIVTVSSEIVQEAIDCSILQKLSFWDALIIASAESAKCQQIWTEDLNEGQIVRGVRIVNPLK
jgi:predicted nucleic acid-binding protein